MVGAAPVCPPERPRSGVSIHRRHVLTRKSGVSIHKQCLLTSKHVCAFADGCALAGRHGRAHRHRPYQPPSNPSSGNHFLCLSVGEHLATTINSFLCSGKHLAATIIHFSAAASTSPRLYTYVCNATNYSLAIL